MLFQKIKNIFFNSLLMIFSIVTFLMIHELVLQYVNYSTFLFLDENELGDVQRKHYWCDNLIEKSNIHLHIHEIYGWTERPNARYFEKLTNADGWHFHSYNSYGFRGAFTPEKKITFVFGDSFTRGNLADNSQTMPALLSSWTPNRAFFNFGTGGYGTVQEYLVYKDYADKFEHDTVLVFFYLGNDADNNVKGGWRPQLVMKGDKLELIKPNINKLKIELAPNPKYENIINNLFFKVKYYIMENSLLYQYYVPKIKVAAQRLGIGQAKQENDDTHGKADEVSLDTKISITSRILRDFSEEVTKRGKRFYIVLLPERGEIDPRRARHRSGTEYYVELRAALMKLGRADPRITVWDATGAIRSAFQGGQHVYGIRDSHFSEMGYYKAAAFVFARLQEEGIIDPTLIPSEPDPLPDFTALAESELICP